MAIRTEKHFAKKKALTTRVAENDHLQLARDSGSNVVVKRTLRSEKSIDLTYRNFDELRFYLREAGTRERIQIERYGVPHDAVESLIRDLKITTSEFRSIVQIPKATYAKKMREKAPLTGASGHSVVALIDLINKVEDMLSAETDNPATHNFDVTKWVGEWIQLPQPALGGLAPAELMDTPSGRESVMRVLGSIQSGAYL